MYTSLKNAKCGDTETKTDTEVYGCYSYIGPSGSPDKNKCDEVEVDDENKYGK